MSDFGVTDNLELTPQDGSGFEAATSVAQGDGAALAQPGYARYDIITLARLRDYQSEIERASALLCKMQPDLIAGEMVPVKATEAKRARWPFVLTLSVTVLFWVGLAWATATLI